MRTRHTISVGIGVVVWSVGVTAQSATAIQPDALAPKYLDAVGGLSLEDAIARAVAHEPSLEAARTETVAARGMRLQAGLHPNPTVSFMQQEEPAGTDNQTRIELQWPLDLFRQSARLAVADREVEASQHATANRERLLASEVRLKYGEAAAAIRELSIADEVIAAANRQNALVRARVEHGSAPPLEGNMLNVDVRRLHAERLLQAGRVEGALVELKRLLGESPGDRLQLRDTLESLVDAEDRFVPPSDQHTVERTRADVREAEARLRAADAQINRARQEGRFDVSVFGMYMRMDAGFAQQGFNAAGRLERVRGLFHYVAGGAMVTLPVRNRNQGDVASAEARRAGAEATLSAVKLTAEAELAAAKSRDDYARRALAEYADGARSQARQNLEVVTQTYELGRATVFDVLDERRRYLDFERAYTAALREAYEARTAVRRAVGDLR